MEPSLAIQELKAMKAANPDRRGDTLLDLEKRDFDNYEHLLNSTHEEGFRSMRDAMLWISFANTKALKSLGVDFHRIMLEVGIAFPRLHMHSKIDKVSKIADAKVKELKITVESRRYEEKEDRWKDGIYILKRGEIAFYISYPEKAVIETPSRRWALRSNIYLEDKKAKVFSIAGLN